MNSDQTAPKGAVRSGFILFAIKASKLYVQKTEHTSIVVKSGEKSENVLT